MFGYGKGRYRTAELAAFGARKLHLHENTGLIDSIVTEATTADTQQCD